MRLVGPVRYCGPSPDEAWKKARVCDLRYLDRSVFNCCAGVANSGDWRDCTCEHDCEWRDTRQLAEAGVEVAYRMERGELVIDRPVDAWASPHRRARLLAHSLVVMR
jgi:hypothetical protein